MFIEKDPAQETLDSSRSPTQHPQIIIYKHATSLRSIPNLGHPVLGFKIEFKF